MVAVDRRQPGQQRVEQRRLNAEEEGDLPRLPIPQQADLCAGCPIAWSRRANLRQPDGEGNGRRHRPHRERKGDRAAQCVHKRDGQAGGSGGA